MSDDRELQKRWKELANRISKEHERKKIVLMTQELIEMLDKHTESAERERERHRKSA